jgi:hypothetical protein
VVCGFENSLALDVITKCTAEFGETEKVAVNYKIPKNKI